MSKTVFLNGKYVPDEKALVHVEDRGLNFADGLYEVMRIYRGKPFTLDRHIRRLEKGARAIELEYGYTVDDFAEIIDNLVSRDGKEEASVYLQVTRGRASREHTFPEHSQATVFLFLKDMVPLTLEERMQGERAITHPDLRFGYCSIKTVALLPNMLMRQAAKSVGALEAILVRDGLVTEGSATNVYIVDNGVVKTFPLTNILPGITRSVVAEVCGEAGIPFIEQPFTVPDMYSADELFITGSTREVMPIVDVDGRRIGSGRGGPVTEKIISGYIKVVEKECGGYFPD